MISDTAYSKIKTYLENAGFAVQKDFCGEVKPGGGHQALVNVKQTELGELTMSGAKPECRAVITFSIRALGTKAGFFDAEKLAQMTESAAARIFFSADMIVRRLVCGAPKKNMSLGRLEQLLEVTVVSAIGKESFQ